MPLSTHFIMQPSAYAAAWYCSNALLRQRACAATLRHACTATLRHACAATLRHACVALASRLRRACVASALFLHRAFVAPALAAWLACMFHPRPRVYLPTPSPCLSFMGTHLRLRCVSDVPVARLRRAFLARLHPRSSTHPPTPYPWCACGAPGSHLCTRPRALTRLCLSRALSHMRT